MTSLAMHDNLAASPRDLTVTPMIKRHAEDAAFYWKQRSGNTYSTVLTFERLTYFDGLLNAHLNGLRIAGDEAWEIALANLRRWRMAGECFVASLLMLESGDAARADIILQIVRPNTEAMLNGLVSALAWVSQESAQQWLAAWLLPSASPLLQTVALRALGLRRSLPSVSLLPFFDVDEPSVRAAAAELVGRLRWHKHTPQVQALLKDEALCVRAAAAVALPYLGITASAALQQSVQELNTLAQSQGGLTRQLTEEHAMKLVRHLGMSMPYGDPALMHTIQTLPPRQMLTMLAYHGDPASVPWLISSSQRADMARLSAWAISMITGLDLDAQRMTQAAPPEPEASEQYERKRPISEPDIGLPWPNVPALQAWWQQQQDQFPQCRLVYGSAADDPAHCLNMLAHGPQAARYAAASALAMQDMQWPLFETRVASIAQREELADLMQEMTA